MNLPANLAAAALLTDAHSQLPDSSTVPDLTAYTRDSEAFHLRSRLKGHHSAIVFACLT